MPEIVCCISEADPKNKTVRQVYFLLNFHSNVEETEDAKKRQTYSLNFKAKVAFAALKGEKTLATLASEYDLHVNQIRSWRNQLKDNMASLFDTGIEQRKDQDVQIQALQSKIGQLTMENDFLAKVPEP